MSVLNWSGVLSPGAVRRAPGEPAEHLVLDVRDLRMRYGRTDVLSGVSFGAGRGEVLALLGPNGAGKTTTIEILEGFRMRSSGRVSVLGTDPAHGGEAWRAFPLYWLGLGTRSALLPASLASVEIGHSWRHLATFGVLGAWAVAGLLVAPILLRRVARRESGSSVAARREKALQHVG